MQQRMRATKVQQTGNDTQMGGGMGIDKPSMRKMMRMGKSRINMGKKFKGFMK